MMKRFAYRLPEYKCGRLMTADARFALLLQLNCRKLQKTNSRKRKVALNIRENVFVFSLSHVS